jgi:hypothetical protein
MEADQQSDQVRLMSAALLKGKAASRNVIRSFKSVNSSAKPRRDLLVFMGDIHKEPLAAVPEPALRPKSTTSFASRNTRHIFSVGLQDIMLGSTPLFSNVKTLDLKPTQG